MEATCWPDEGRRGDGEIIEIGCVRMSQSTRGIVDEFSTLVRPERYPTLSTYCTNLTSITQADVEKAPRFPDAYASLVEWMGPPSDMTLCSWGAYDCFLLRQSCRFHRLTYPFDDEYINIKPAFSEAFSGRGVSMPRAMEMAEIPQQGTFHRGIDDARNAAKLWQIILREHRRIGV
ncbi:MAG: 3'-5' exonuclease [Candidatus Kapaibacterium sp.]